MQKSAWWVPGDWNALFGLGTNVLVNLLVLTVLLKFVVQIPDAVLFGNILPAVGLMLFLGNMYYAWMAKRLADRTGRSDVAALPSGPSVPHMFFVTLAIMLPIKLKTGDPIQGWEVGLAWVFIEGVVLMIGAFVAPHVRRLTPRAALLGTLAGVSITFISMKPAMEIFESPVIGLVSFAIILGGWYGGVRYPGKIPAGLVAIGVGTLLAWLATAVGWDSIAMMSTDKVVGSVSSIAFTYPIPVIGNLISGLEQYWAFVLATAIPFGVYDFIEAMDNVESASAAGDEYSEKEAIGAEGLISLVGTLFGSPFANAVYIGHPGWKQMGGRIGYSVATGVFVLLVTWLSIVGLLLAVIPQVAIIPILLYIGMMIGAQAFQSTPASHAPAVVLALIPNLAAWAKVLIDGSLGAAGTNAAKVGMDKLAQNGVLYEGLSLLGNGAILVGLLFGAIAVFIIEGKSKVAANFALVGAVLTYFGLIHGPSVGVGNGLGVTPMVTLAYLLAAAVLYWQDGLEKSTGDEAA
jgi:adenine/guanine/hypoxanthine permease